MIILYGFTLEKVVRPLGTQVHKGGSSCGAQHGEEASCGVRPHGSCGLDDNFITRVALLWVLLALGIYGTKTL